MKERTVGWASRAAPGLAAAVLAAGVGWIAPGRPVIALVCAAVVLILGVSALQSAIVPLAALPVLYVAARVDLGFTDVSVSDIALGIATLAALIVAPRPFNRPMRTLLWLTAIYQAATLFTVVANPYSANAIEWVHAGVLTAGALLVGWSVGRNGLASTGLKLMLVAAFVLATWIIIVGLLHVARGDFRPVYLPNGMHKNFLGTVLGTSALIAYVRPEWLRLSPRTATVAFWWLATGIGFTQSRQAIVALGVVLVVLVLRTRTDRRRSRTVLWAIVPAFFIVMTLVRDQLASDNVHNSANQRLTWLSDSYDVWMTQPITGVGLRWWYTDRFPSRFQPPNAEMEVLTSAGVLGLAGFLVLMVGALIVLWRLPPAYGALGLLAVLSRFVQGQLDLFWVAGQVSIPFVIAGICLGAQALHEESPPSVVESDVTEAAEGFPRDLTVRARP